MRNIVLILLVATVFFAVELNSKEKVASLAKMERAEKAGVRYYKKGNYEKAFEKLYPAAKWGMKQPQYLLGIMHLKGQHVEQSIGKGLAWLGVAKEISINDWGQVYEGIYQKLNQAQREYIDNQVEIYIDKYGIKANKLTCEKMKIRGTTKHRVHCQKRGTKIDDMESNQKGSLFKEATF